MKVSAVAFALTALLVGTVAQSLYGLSGLPSCALSCVSLPSSCSPLDVQCICSAQTFISEVTCCVTSACDAADQQTALNFAQQLCSSAGVTLSTSACASSASKAVSTSGAASASKAVSTSGAASASKAVSTSGAASTSGAITQPSGLPSCVQPCIQLQSSCNPTDFKCICSSQTVFQGIICCVTSACNEADRTTAAKVARQICSSVGVALPTSLRCTTGTPRATAASTPSASAGLSPTIPSSIGTATNLGTGTTTASAPALKTGTSAAAPIVHSQNSGAFAAVGAAAAFVAMLLM